MPRVRRLLTLLFLGASCCGPLAAADERRLLDDGPLRVDDFRGAAPDAARLTANTATEIRNDYRYRFETRGDRTTVTLTAIEVNAYVRRDQSWNRDPRDRALLEHEQGHADNARIECLRARLTFRELLDRRSPKLRATAATKDEAAAALDRQVAELMEVHVRAMNEADAAYDRETMHGLGSKQAEWRRVQTETLKDLRARLSR